MLCQPSLARARSKNAGACHSHSIAACSKDAPSGDEIDRHGALNQERCARRPAAILIASGQGGSETASPAAGALAPTSGGAASLRSFYFGAATIDGIAYYAEALVTRDGAVRLYIDGTGQGTSAQFVGQLDPGSHPFTGSGMIIGQKCAAL